MSSRKEAVLSSVARNVAEHNRDGEKSVNVRVPEELKGSYEKALVESAAAEANAERYRDTPFAFANVVVRSSDEFKRLRTGADLVSDLTSDVSEVKTLGQAQAFAEEVQRRFSKTGVYKSVVVKEEVSKSGKGSDCVIELDEANVNFQQGFSRSSTGAVGSTTMMSLYNQLGWGERWSVNVGAAVGSDALSAEPGSSFMQKAQNAKEMITPRIEVGFSKPTFFGHRAPFGITYSSDTQRYDTTLGFSKKLSELELSVSHPSNRHSLSYSFSTRDILPLPHPTSDYQTASAPHVVASANTSTKSSLRYSYAINNLNVHPANNVVVPSGGYRLNTDLEVAGPGGEAHFVKGEAHLATGFSLWRYQPDTGYQKPLPSAEFIEREATLASGGAAAEVLKSREEQDNAAMGNLKPFPGTKVFCPTMMFGLKKKNPHTSTQSSLPTLTHRAKPYTFGERMAGWLSPGFTFLFDASFGLMRGYGPDAGASFSSSSAGAAVKPKAGDASPAPLASSASSTSSAGLPRLADRFFVTSARMRGFEAIGPIAPRVKPHGSPFGDAIGGDCYGVLTARLLMPPPIPSVRIANAGVRTQLWATAGKVGSVDSMMGHFNQDVLTDPAKLAKRVFAGSKTWSASAGIGISTTLPGMPIAFEINVPLWHSAQSDDTKSARGSFNIFWTA